MNLYGASGHGKVILDIVRSMGLSVDAVYDDQPTVTELLDVPVLHASLLDEATTVPWLLSIGNNEVRQRVASRLSVAFGTAIHDKAIVAPSVSISEGTVVMAGAVVNPDTTIGKHCIVNTGATVDHDCRLGDFVHIAPNAALAGNVEVGEGTHIGIGASVIQGIRIGKWAVIGAGTAVIRDVPDYAVVVGCPGKVIRYREETNG